MDAEPDKAWRTLGPQAVTVLGLAGNLALSGAKLAAGWFCFSQAIFADGLHSLSDCATDLAVLAGLRISGQPADDCHPYGHRRAMTLVTAALALILLGAGGWVVYVALRDMARAHHAVRVGLPLAIAIVSVVSKEALYHVTVRVGRRAGDLSVVANAWHHRSDAWSSVVAAVGLAAVAIGGPRWQFLDHVAAMVLASFLAVVAVRLLREAGAELMDEAPGAELMRPIEQAVANTPGVDSFHAVRARRLGGKLDMDIHVQVDPDLTVRQGHDIATEVRRQVMNCCPNVLSVIVQVEPKEPEAGRLVRRSSKSEGE